jgi:DNA-binding transcriptional regulator YiaG
MPNIAAVFKEEIARIARKELRQETEALKKSVSTLRSQLAAAKKQLQEQDRQLRALRKSASRSAERDAEPSTDRPLRFSAARFAAQRKRLGLSAEQFGRLIGASGQSIYLWERGKTRPSAENLASIASLRSIGKRALAQRLAALE